MCIERTTALEATTSTFHLALVMACWRGGGRLSPMEHPTIARPPTFFHVRRLRMQVSASDRQSWGSIRIYTTLRCQDYACNGTESERGLYPLWNILFAGLKLIWTTNNYYYINEEDLLGSSHLSSSLRW